MHTRGCTRRSKSFGEGTKRNLRHKFVQGALKMQDRKIEDEKEQKLRNSGLKIKDPTSLGRICETKNDF